MSRPAKVNKLSMVRNFGIAAHIDAGKTTLTERILYLTGASHKIGEVHDGNTQMDYMPEERDRGITITSAVTYCEWEKHPLHLIDTPGHVDFTIEVERSMRVLDGVVIVLDAVKGVEPQSETVWRQAERHTVPRIIFVNKMDRPGADFDRANTTVVKRLGGAPVIVSVPILRDGKWGILDVVEGEWVTFSGERNCNVHREAVPAHLEEDYEEWRERLLESCSDLDDAIAEAYLGGEDIENATLKKALRDATLACRIQPTFGGSALKDFGTQLVLDGVLDYLPSPLDVGTIIGKSVPDEEPVEVALVDDGPLVALVFKVQMIDTRRHVYLRIYRGQLHPGDQVYNNRTGKLERVARIFGVRADKKERLHVAGAGDLILCAGMRLASTSDTLSDPEAKVTLAPIEATEPVIALSIETVHANQDDKVLDALNKMVEEDPTLRLIEDEDSGQRLLYGMGELHLEVVLDRMGREYNVEFRKGRPRVVYRESIAGNAERGFLVDRTLENGQVQKARVKVSVETASQEEGCCVHFEPSKIRMCPEGATLSANQLLWVEDSATLESQTGPLSGFPLVGVKLKVTEVELFGASSSEPAIREATARAVRAAMMAADPHPLAPIMYVEVEVPTDFVGSVIGDMQSRGGSLLGIDTAEGSEGISQLKADCAMEQLFGYATELRSMTQGRGTFTLRFTRFDRVAMAKIE